MRKQALMYGRDPQKKVTKYQQLINDAAATIVIETPALLSSRSKLLDLAREKVYNDGYVFKKGKSRSKKHSIATDPEAPEQPRQKTGESFRLKRISQLQDDIKDFNDHLKLKEKRRDQASNSRNYKLCDEVMEEMSTIKIKKRECEAEVQQLQRKQKKSSWYYKKQKNKDTSSLVSNSSELLTEPSRNPSPKRRRMSSTSCASTPASGNPGDLSLPAQSSDSSDSEDSRIDDRSLEPEEDAGTSVEQPFP